MSRMDLPAHPTVNGSRLLTVKEIARNNISLTSSSQVPSAESAIGGGWVYVNTGTTWNVFGGGAYIRKGSGAAIPGSWMEWDLGFLQCDREWGVIISYWTNVNAGIVEASMDGVSLGTFDAYTASWNVGHSVHAWTPTSDDMWRPHTFRLTVTGKNASATYHAIMISGIALSRKATGTVIQVNDPQ